MNHRTYTVHVGKWNSDMRTADFWAHTLYEGDDPVAAEAAHRTAKRMLSPAYHVASFCHLLFLPGQRIDRCEGLRKPDKTTLAELAEFGLDLNDED